MATEKIETTVQQQGDVDIACTLSEEELAVWSRDVFNGLRSGAEQINELPDGYELRFSGRAEWIAKLAEFITNERACCSFFRFELIVEPNGGPISLRLRGPEGVKELVKGMMDTAVV